MCRIFLLKQNYDIIKDEAFKSTRTVVQAKLVDLKRKGHGDVKHVDAITVDDLRRIGSMRDDTPVFLQLKVWFFIQFYFCRRGLENSHTLKKDDVIFHEEDNNRPFVSLRDCVTKKSRIVGDRSYEGVMPGGCKESCPVSLLQKYIKKLNPKNEYMWQRPVLSFRESDCVWYVNQKIGINTVAKFMQQISHYAKLSKAYTNHCVRATSITVMSQAWPDTDVQVISGHKSLNALGIYKKMDKDKKIKIGDSLRLALGSRDISASIPIFHGVAAEPEEAATAANGEEIEQAPTLKLASTDPVVEQYGGPPVLEAEPLSECSTSIPRMVGEATVDEEVERLIGVCRGVNYKCTVNQSFNFAIYKR